MNIEVCGRIRPSLRAEGAENLVIEGQRLAAHPRGPYLNFKALHRQDASNLDLFRSSVDELLDFFLAGFNVCLMVMGESGSGKTYTLAGEGTSRAGIVPMIFDTLFTRLQGERYMADSRRVKRDNPIVSLEMFEVYNELIKDLQQVPGSSSSYLELGETAEKGTYVKNAASVSVRDAGEGSAKFREGMSRRTEQSTDYGPAMHNASTVIHIDLQMLVGENPSPNKSRCTILELPGLEKLSDDPNQLRQREGPALSKALIALNQVITSLSSNPFPDRVINYSDSKLTRLLRNELGGNCKSRAILCLKPSTNSDILTAILNFTTRVTQVKNFPIVNDSYAQNLLTQYQARIIDLQQQAGVGPAPLAARMTNAGDVKETIRSLETENLRLKDENERLRVRMESMQNKFGSLAHTKTDLSNEILLTEEEKLKLSQSLVEMNIENNKILEEAEATKFELTNKIIMLESELLEAQQERDRAVRQARHSKERLAEMEKDRKDLADEYVVLKTNYLALVREHEKETDRNEEMSVELLNLVNTKAALMKQLAILNNGDGYNTGEADREVDRVKAIVIQKSSGKVKADQILGSQRERDSIEQSLFANKKRYESELERLRREHGDEHGKMSQHVTDLQRELQDARNLARERQQKISEINAALIMARSDKEQLEVQVNRLQHKCKDLGEDFRMRLIKYVEDISDYMDGGGGVPDAKREKKMKVYVDNMLKDITMSHKDREDQLSHAAQQYREQKRKFAHKYEELLVAYRNLRLTCEQRGIDPIDLGPDEHKLSMSDSDITTNHLKEINRLKSERDEIRDQLNSMKNKYGLTEDFKEISLRPGEKPAETWAQLRKQLREFTLNTQRQLEDERTKLLSENEVLKEQLKESQDYIDSHLAKYKQEIIKLRKMLGYDEDGMVITDRSGKSRSRRY
ncbi:coiled-coil domain-containing protein 78-like isoform X2 [Mercenaria mercenaria]|uniref:coiled-coil domain-containing protein 78-like isoform X2 n=1 Tax=Mercenaria mercenaria TaxID=6596 RepID=UPI00234E917A|nr:coiled-coil domain-containing protein 78-like isoform X2 [Mercenaria mercenaria]